MTTLLRGCPIIQDGKLIGAVDRVALTIENMEKWGTQWIVFPNAVYGSSANYAMQYGFLELFDHFDYTREDSDAWKLYE